MEEKWNEEKGGRIIVICSSPTNGYIGRLVNVNMKDDILVEDVMSLMMMAMRTNSVDLAGKPEIAHETLISPVIGAKGPVNTMVFPSGTVRYTDEDLPDEVAEELIRSYETAIKR